MGRIVHSDLDCADCACRVCARSTYNDCSNPECEWAECSPCENCIPGVSQLIETQDDCDRFLPDFDDLPEREREKALYRTINRKLAAAAPIESVTAKRFTPEHIPHTPMPAVKQPKNVRKPSDALVEVLRQYFGIGDSYTYELTRDKKGFAIGTVDLDDFEEWDEENVKDLAQYIVSKLPEVLDAKEDR